MTVIRYQRPQGPDEKSQYRKMFLDHERSLYVAPQQKLDPRYKRALARLVQQSVQLFQR